MEEENNKQLYTIILRHDTSTNWAANNPILSLGEYGVEDDTHKVKRGDGEKEWNSLPYEDFGLKYLVTYENLSGKVTDNTELTEALNKKVSIEVFKNVQYQSVSSVDLSSASGDIGKLTKISKNINTGLVSTDMIYIVSNDNSINGYWSVDENSNRILSLEAESTISDYELEHDYYKDQLCYHNNILYRAVENFKSEKAFRDKHWAIIASLNSNDIKYDNLVSGLDSETVKDALDELKRRNDTKLAKSTEENVVYGTTKTGTQTVIPVDNLRTVDSVNGKKATDQDDKNIQIDSSEINYDDTVKKPKTIRQTLDEKIDKNFAGEGETITKAVKINYNDENGQIELTETKISPETYAETEETTTVDVVSEQELKGNVDTINATINNINEGLTERITNEVATLNKSISDTDKALSDRITLEVNTLSQNIQDINSTLDKKIDTEVANLTKSINDESETLNNKIDNNKEATDNRITNEVAALNNTITATENKLDKTISDEITKVNKTITDDKAEVNTRIDTEVATLNDTINTEKANLTEYIDKQDNLKIDKDIADNILTQVEVATVDKQPTIKFKSKNTSSKEAINDYVHFTTTGKIKVGVEDEDHIVIDSSNIDDINTQQDARLLNAEDRLNAHDTQIASLLNHEVQHDKQLATHTETLTTHSNNIETINKTLTDLDTNIKDVDSKVEDEITNRKTSEASIETDISRNAVNIENNTAAIRTNADSITELNNLLQENVTNLTQSKVDKTFADETDGNVIGDLVYSNKLGANLLNIQKQKVSPKTGTLTNSDFEITSSNNTLVAKAVYNDDNTELIGLDLETNLDIDVNYFVTTEILNTKVTSENIVSLNSLTATDKTEVEVRDIISDTEGTWSRVKSIDKEAGTCTTVTFAKHAQAVWGTVKGTLVDQTDLNNELNNRVKYTELFGYGQSQTDLTYKLMHDFNIYPAANNVLEFGRIYQNIFNVEPETGGSLKDLKSLDNAITFKQDEEYSFAIDIEVNSENIGFNPEDSGISNTTIAPAIREVKTTLEGSKLNKQSTPNTVYGIDENGNQVNYSTDTLGKVDTVNNITPIDRNVTITGNDIQLTSTEGDNNIATYIQGLLDSVNQIQTEAEKQFQEYTQGLDLKIGTFIKHQFVTFTRDDGIMLVAKVLKDFTTDVTKSTVYDSFKFDMEAGNLKLIGVPEEVGTSTTNA